MALEVGIVGLPSSAWGNPWFPHEPPPSRRDKAGVSLRFGVSAVTPARGDCFSPYGDLGGLARPHGPWR